jgi:hypothetical protein
MLSKVFFDKIVFVKFKISNSKGNNFNQNIDETDSKQQKSIEKSKPAYGF